MNERILIITPPDDILLQGIRIAHVDLTEEQSFFVSNSLLNIELPDDIINYVWKVGDPTDWLFDKLLKSDLIIFNADSSNQTLVGWLSAQRNALWFGDLKDLQTVNNRAIYNVNDILISLEKISKNYEQIQ